MYNTPIPLVTGWGRGLTPEEAKQKSAQKTLALFKILRKLQDI
jgi:hypothetical protein